MRAFPEMLPLIIDSALKGTVLLGLAALAALWLRRGSAASRHMAWQLGLMGVLVLPAVSKFAPWHIEVPLGVDFNRFVSAVATPSASVSSSNNGAAPVASATDRTSEVKREDAPVSEREQSAAPPPQEPTSPGAQEPAPFLQRAAPWVFFIWLAGVAAVVSRFLIGLAVAQWYTRKARPLDAIEWASLNETMSFAVGLGHPVQLLKSERAATPMTFGVINPIVLLPADADEWPEERRRIVLLHELAHVHRLDSLTHIFACLACALYWFNPLVWITAGRLRAEAERACDDWVLRAGMRASTYADHLLDMVRTIGRLHTPAVALPMAQRSTFEGRLLAILEPGLNRNGLTRGQAVLLTSIIALVVFPLAAMAPAKAEAGSNAGANASLPTSAALFQDTSLKTRTRPTQNQNGRGFIDGADIPGLVNNALNRVDIKGVAKETFKNLDVGDMVSDALNGRGQQKPQMSDKLLTALVVALEDDDVDVRRSAIHTLGQQEDPRAVVALSKSLREDKDAQVRRTAAWALGQIESASAVPALSDALRRDDDVEVRRTAAWALGQIESASAVDALNDALKDADQEVRSQSVWALGNIQDARAVPALTTALRDGDASVRRQATWALGNIESRASVPALTTALRDRDAQVRETAVWALGNIEVPEAVEPLAAMLNDDNATVRRQVVWALGNIQSRSAVDALSRVLRDDQDANVRETAAWALGQIEDQSAIPALAAALKDAAIGVRRTAAWALGQIEHRPAPQQLLDAVKDQDLEVRRTALWALGQIEDPNSAGALKEALKDSDPQVKGAALRALTAIGDEAAFEVLADMLKDSDPAVRKMAAQALGRGGNRWPEPRPRPRPQPRPQPRPRPFGG